MIALQDSATKAIDYPTRFDTVTIPRPSEKCQADAGVHKAVATLGAAVTTVMGIFSCFTAGYWGQVSELCSEPYRILILESSPTDAGGLCSWPSPSLASC